MKQQQTAFTTGFGGLLAGLRPGQLQSWGLLDVLPLFLSTPHKNAAKIVSPGEHLKLVRVVTYGTIVLANESHKGPLIVPMHIGFFQSGAQNHATSQVLILEAGEERTLTDAFCIQASQGGYLQEAQQRFMMLPLQLRKQALALRNEEGFSRLWGSIDAHNRRYGIKSGGHLERFLRPNFHRLMRFRHAIELMPGQIGAAYFVAGNLVGVEVGPNPAYWQTVGPILTIYSYGAAALLAERHRLNTQRQVVDLDGIQNLEDLNLRLNETRQQETRDRIDHLNALAGLAWKQAASEEQARMQIINLEEGEWVGQTVQGSDGMLYLSVFRDMLV